MADPESRKATLDEIFRRMAEHVEPAKAKGHDAVIHFKILDAPGGGSDHYEVVLEDGACTVTDEPRASRASRSRSAPSTSCGWSAATPPGRCCS